jgi:hypothetical protein
MWQLRELAADSSCRAAMLESGAIPVLAFLLADRCVAIRGSLTSQTLRALLDCTLHTTKHCPVELSRHITGIPICLQMTLSSASRAISMASTSHS